MWFQKKQEGKEAKEKEREIMIETQKIYRSFKGSYEYWQIQMEIKMGLMARGYSKEEAEWALKTIL